MNNTVQTLGCEGVPRALGLDQGRACASAIRVWLRSARAGGGSTDGFHDNVSLALEFVTPIDPITWSRVKAIYRKRVEERRPSWGVARPSH